MEPQTIATSSAPDIHIENVSDSLQVKGWERAEVSVRIDPELLTLSVEEQEDVVQLSSLGDLSIRVPFGASLKIGSVHGDATIKLLEGDVAIENVGGSLVLRNLGEVQVETIGGDLSAKRIAGALQVKNVGGSAQARGVQDACVLENVGGDLDVRSAPEGLKSKAGGSVRLRLEQVSGGTFQVGAGGDVDIFLPEEAGATLQLNSAAESIRVRRPSGSQSFAEAQKEIVLGDGEAQFSVKSGGGIRITLQAGGWDEDEEREGAFGFGPDAGRITEEFSQQISRQVEAQMEAMANQLSQLSERLSRAGLSPESTEEVMRRARETSERATERAQERMRRAQEKLERKLEATRRKNEVKAQAAERRAQQGRSRRGWGMDWPTPPGAPTPPPPPKEAVSDEERLMILRMLEQKKISLEEAEKLLAALEGKGA